MSNIDKKSSCAICRRIGKRLMLKDWRCDSPKCSMVKHNYPPGIHGANKGRGRQSNFALQLNEKQLAKAIYGLREKQFKLTFERAQKKGDAGENLLRFLELRFDNVIYRLGLAGSRAQARQLVNHGHFLINGRKVNIPSYQMKPNDIVTIRPSSKNSKIFVNIQEKLKKHQVPGWLHFDLSEMKAKVLHLPNKEDFEPMINSQMIVEFYSR